MPWVYHFPYSLSIDSQLKWIVNAIQRDFIDCAYLLVARLQFINIKKTTDSIAKIYNEKSPIRLIESSESDMH